MEKYNLIINLKGGSLDEQGVVRQMINNNIKAYFRKSRLELVIRFNDIKWLEMVTCRNIQKTSTRKSIDHMRLTMYNVNNKEKPPTAATEVVVGRTNGLSHI